MVMGEDFPAAEIAAGVPLPLASGGSAGLRIAVAGSLVSSLCTVSACVCTSGCSVSRVDFPPFWFLPDLECAS